VENKHRENIHYSIAIRSSAPPIATQSHFAILSLIMTMAPLAPGDHIVALAPMDGITNCAYRTITKELFAQHNTDPHARLRMWTEFMNVEGFMREPGRLIHHMIKTEFEDQTVAQIYGADHHDLVASAQYIDQHMGLSHGNA